MPKKYRITLTREERELQEGILRRGKVAALKQRHTRILLLADENAELNTTSQINRHDVKSNGGDAEQDWAATQS